MQVGKFLIVALIALVMFVAVSAHTKPKAKASKPTLGYILKALVGSAKVTALLRTRTNLSSDIKKTVTAGLKKAHSSKDAGVKSRLSKWLEVVNKNGVNIKKNGAKFNVAVNRRSITKGSSTTLSPAEKALVAQYRALFGKIHAQFGQSGAEFSIGFGAFLGGNSGLKFAQLISDLTKGVSKKGAFNEYKVSPQKKEWTDKVTKILGAEFVKKFKGTNKKLKAILTVLKNQTAKQQNALVNIQSSFVKKPLPIVKPVETPSAEEGGPFWRKGRVQGKPKSNNKEEKRQLKCSCEKIEGGNRKVCCAWKDVCTGTGKDRVCKKVEKNCKTKKIWIDKRTYTCQWHKRDDKTHQQRCCLQVTSCCGKICKTETPNCEWRGQMLTTEFHRGCSWKPKGQHARQRQCCDTKRVCQGDKCQEVKFGCKWVGEALSSFVEEKCNWEKQSKDSSRRKCCRNRVSCVENICKREKIGCKWTSQVVTRKAKRRCEWRRYQTGKRLRCCSWISSCAKQRTQPIKCLHHSGKCFWRGEIVSETEEQKCSWVKTGEGVMQKRCCIWLKKCNGKVCTNGPVKCRDAGEPIKTEQNDKCEWKLLEGGRGKVQYCCKHTQVCQGGSCKTTTSDCKRGRTIISISRSKCRWVKKGEGKQRRCCSWVKRCENNNCRIVAPKCSWVGDHFISKKKQSCSFKSIPNGKQRECCSYLLRCVGKQCYTSKFDCKNSGEPETTTTTNKCSWTQIAPGKRQRKCCTQTTTCVGKKCHTAAGKCEFVGHVISKKRVNGCKFVKVGKDGRKRQCCTIKNTCTAGKCTNTKTNCKFVGPLITLKESVKCSDVKIRHNASRKECCTYLTRCVEKKGCKTRRHKCSWQGEVVRNKRSVSCKWTPVNADEKNKVCCVTKSVCTGKKCAVSSNECKTVKTVKISRKSECKWRPRKGGKQRQCCAYTERCVNKVCKNLHTHCEWTGFLLTKKWKNNCRFQKVSDNARRLYCCKFTKECQGKKCKTVKSACKFQGPTHTRTFSLKCSTVHYNKACGTGFKRERCCGVIKSCVGSNCKTSRGQCKFVGKEKKINPTPKKKVSKPVKKVPKTFKVGKKPVRKSVCNKVKGRLAKYNCRRRFIVRFFKCYNNLKKKGKFLPSKVVRKFKFCNKAQRQFKILNKFKSHFKSSPKLIQKKVLSETRQLQRKLQMKASFCSRKSFSRKIVKGKITTKLPKKKPTKKPTKKVTKKLMKQFRKIFLAPRKQRKTLLKKKVQPKKPKKVIKPIKRVTCDLYADPHARSFDGKYFEAQTVGSWKLHWGPTLKVDYTGKSFGRWVGVVEWIVDVNGDKVRSKGFNGVFVNGKDVHLQEKVPFELTNGGSITKVGNKITISSKKGEEVDFVSFGSFFNAYVRSSRREVSGLCSHQFIRSTLFGHPVKGKKLPVPKLHCPEKAAHTATCRAKGLKGRAALNCVFDLCAKFPKKIEKKIIKWNKKENKKKTPKKPTKKPFIPIKRVTCDLYADPHARSFDGKYFEAQTVGGFVLHKGPFLKAVYNGKSFGRWVGVVEWIVNVKGDIVRNVGFNKVSVNGELQNLVNGKTVALPKGGSLTQTGSKFNINSNEGEVVDFITFGSFFNAYVRSNQPKVSGLCSHQFIKSNAFGPKPGKVLPKPKVNCPNKKKHTATCRGKGLVGVAQTNCVFDLCAKFPREIEDKIIRDTKKENRKRPHRLATVKRVTCDLYADPHARSFDGKYFEAQTEGAWTLHEGPTLKLDYIGKRFGGWVGVVEWIANVKGDIVRNNGFGGFTINGQASSGTVKLPHGGTVIQAGNKITIKSNEGEEADFISFGSFFNAYVRSNLFKVSGLCSHQFIRSTAFSHPHPGIVLPKPKLNCPNKAIHMRTCKGKGLKGNQQLNCAFDLCAKFPTRIERKIIRDNRKENRIPIRIPKPPRRPPVRRLPQGPRRPNPPPVRRVPNIPRPVGRPPVVRPPHRPVVDRRPPPAPRRPPPPPPRRPPPARRRGRGASDVHLHLRGKDITENFTGIINFFKTKGVVSQVRYSAYGNGAAITGFAAKVGASMIKVSSINKVLEVEFNDEPMEEGKEIVTKEMVVRRNDKKSEVLIDVRGVFRCNVIYDANTKALDVNLNIQDKVKKYSGLLKTPSGKKNAVKSFENSLFVDFEPYRKTSGKLMEQFRPMAERVCAKVSREFKKDCKQDVMMTGVDWSHNYQLEAAQQNDAMKNGAFVPKN